MFGVPEEWQCLVAYAQKAPFYQEKYEGNSFQNWHEVPYTTKAELRQAYPNRHFALDWSALATLHTSSGSTGQAVLVGYSAEDERRWHLRLADALKKMHITENDRVQITFGYGLFTGGLGWHGGARALGACVLPASTGKSMQQLQWMHTLQTTVLVATPLYALHLAELAKEENLAIEHLRCIVTGAEPLTQTLRERIQEVWSVPIFDTYGLSEAQGPGVASACHYQTGLHIHSDFFIELYKPVQVGGMWEGELVVTAKYAEAMPLIRYRTGDRVRLCYAKCPCGFQGWSIDTFLGRADDMFSYKGVNIYPKDIEACIQSESWLQPTMQLRMSKDRSHLFIELIPKRVLETEEEQKLCQALETKIKRTLGVRIPLCLQSPDTVVSDGSKHQRMIHE